MENYEIKYPAELLPIPPFLLFVGSLKQKLNHSLNCYRKHFHKKPQIIYMVSCTKIVEGRSHPNENRMNVSTHQFYCLSAIPKHAICNR